MYVVIVYSTVCLTLSRVNTYWFVVTLYIEPLSSP